VWRPTGRRAFLRGQALAARGGGRAGAAARTGGRAGAAALLALTALTAGGAAGQATPPAEPPPEWGPTAADYTNVPYPHPVAFLEFAVHGEDVRLAYMDVAPAGAANGRTVMLFHGMNFFAAAFEPTIAALTAAGFRVVAIDRLGYGRSSKPIIPYNLHLAATNAKRVLDHLGIERAAVVGHSMGGMVAARFAFSYPETATRLVLVNPIGLTDPRGSRPWRDPQEAYAGVLRSTGYPSILRNHMRYYPEWRPEYLQWVRYQYGLTLSGEWPRLARVRALQQQILYEDPVVHDWPHIRTPALVIGGEEDGPRFPELARNAAATLPDAELVLFPGVGHIPQFEIPERFHAELIRFLAAGPTVGG